MARLTWRRPVKSMGDSLCEDAARSCSASVMSFESVSPVLVEERAYQWCPDRNGFGRTDQEMALVAERGKQVILGLAACGGVGLVHPLRKIGTEERVVLDVDPEHRRPRSAS